MAFKLNERPVGVALVTGGSGFVGRALCGRLRERGTRVHVAGRHHADGPWDRFVATDLSRSTLPPEALEGVDTVFHLAAKTHVRIAVGDDPEHEAVTVEGTRRTLDAALRAGVTRFLFMSSVKAAGEPGDMLADEDFDRPPTTPYGRAKREAEELVMGTASESGMHAVVLRPAPVYGPGWKGNLSRMFRAVQAGRFLPPPDTGNRRSMVHVDDIAEAALLAVDRPLADGRVFVLCDGEAYSTRRIYQAMCRSAGRPVPRWEVPAWVLRVAARAGDALGAKGRRAVPFDSEALDRLLGSAWYDSSRARRELGWAPRWTLEAALPDIVAHGALSPTPSPA